jgi:uncharacterized DUF497 family protein
MRGPNDLKAPAHAVRMGRGQGTEESQEARCLVRGSEHNLRRSLALTIPDPLHSEEEDRFVTLGESNRRRLVVVVSTDRDDRIRIISARVATKREKKNYEEGEG